MKRYANIYNSIRGWFTGKLYKNSLAGIWMGLLIWIVVLGGCRKETETVGPSLVSLTDSGLVHGDTTLKAGSAFYVGLQACLGDPVDGKAITNLYIARYHEGGMDVLLDSGIYNDTLIYRKMLNKGVYEEERWTFRVKDIAGKWAEVSFTLHNIPGASYDSVRYVPALTMGAQQCTTQGSFLDVRNMIVYFQEEAFNVQDSIELLYYYDPAGDYNTISSPNANIDATIYTGATGLPFWTVKHESRFLETSLSAAQFDAVVNDSLLIATFDPINSKRKAKNLMSGEVYSFKTSEGKFGLFKVMNVTGAETGTVEIAIKIQP